MVEVVRQIIQVSKPYGLMIKEYKSNDKQVGSLLSASGMKMESCFGPRAGPTERKGGVEPTS